MLELVAATTIITIALVPALRLTRDGITQMQGLELAEMRVSLCASKLEEELSKTAALWQLQNSTGSFAAEGYAELKYTVTKSDATSDGGSPGRLASISVVVWHDADKNNSLGADESRTNMATKIAKIVSYEYEATVH